MVIRLEVVLASGPVRGNIREGLTPGNRKRAHPPHAVTATTLVSTVPDASPGSWLKRSRTRLLCSVLAVALLPLAAVAQEVGPRDGQHDFDFEIGTWATHLSRLQHPLTGSTTWVEYSGTSVVRKVWDGRANLLELDVDGPAGRIEALSLRLYNPQSRQWSLHFASARNGTLTTPAVGEFRGGRGEFHSHEEFNGRAILVRFVISPITPDSWRFEQSFSDDGGRTWEVNWIAVDTRLTGVSEQGP